MFVGRTDLLELIDRLIESEEPDVPGMPRPVLVVEGCGGSGRTALLDAVLDRWSERTPATVVRPLDYTRIDGPGTRPVWPVLIAVMLGLSRGVAGFPMSFPRVIIAQIAIAEDFRLLPVDEQLPRLDILLDQYRNRASLIRFVRELLTATGVRDVTTQMRGSRDLAAVIASGVTDTLVGALLRGRLVTRMPLGTELKWFEHQDLGLHLDAKRALIDLSDSARSRDPGVQRNVEDLLVGALLADLRHSADRITGRTANLVALLDDGDAPTAASFLGSLLRVRGSIEATGGHVGPDPLTVIAVTSGALVDHLAGQVSAPQTWSPTRGARRIDASRTSWARVQLGNLPVAEVRLLAMEVRRFEAEKLGDNVFRLTRGHPETTAFLIDRIRDARSLPDLLDDPGPEPGTTVERHLLRAYVRGLSPHKHVNNDWVEAMITVSAARNLREAKKLEELLPPGIDLGAPLFTNRSLWTPAGAEDVYRTMPFPARYLGMRILLARNGSRDAWEPVLRALRDAVDDEDRAGRMHYDRLLTDSATVVEVLAKQLPTLPAAEWLALFDEIVSAPDPRTPDDRVIDGPDRATTVSRHITVLLTVVPAFDLDLRPTTPEQTAKLCRMACQSYTRLASEANGADPFLERAGRYRILEERYR